MKPYKSIYKEEDMTLVSEMKKHFQERTEKHINLVRKHLHYIMLLGESSIDLGIIKSEITNHDQSKFFDPEYTPYLFITWDYKMKDEGKVFEIPDNIRQKMNEATNHHVKNNKHHPEYWSGQEGNLINVQDRDKPKVLVDATSMPLSYVACMVADWMAMSDEKGTDPYEWADKNINVRWKFDDNQVDLIYYILEKCW